jgi:Lysine-specific metallo-endopeptidase
MYVGTGLKARDIPSQDIGWSTGTLGQAERPVNSFELCGDSQQKAIEAAFVEARRAVNRAEAILGTAYGKGTMAPVTRQLLNSHFHTTDRDHVGEIFRKIFRIGQALQKGLAFKCLGYCGPLPLGDRYCGYAQATQWFGGFGRIRICFDNRPGKACSFTNLKPQEQAAVIIHETAHRHVGIDDKAYVWENPTNSKRDYSTLTPKQAMDNADSYAWFCVQV